VKATLPGRALIVASVGAIGVIIGYLVDPARMAAAYLVAYGACLAVVLGSLAMVMIARVTAATWFVALRRQAEEVTATLPMFAVLLVPVVLSCRMLYPWANGDARVSADHTTAYLNTAFFAVRAIVYSGAWISIAELLRRASLAQDAGDSPRLERRMYVVSVVGLIVLAFTASFAAFDWFMSLDPTWYSTIYGVNYFAGGMVGALALLSVLIARDRRTGELPRAVGRDHYHALAKLLLTFVLFWVYIGFSQFIVIWSAELPAERGWYTLRLRGGWRVLGGVLVAGHFALPFCALLVRAVKRSILAMAGLGVWLVAMHYLDVYWIVMPDAPFHGGWGFGADVAALMFVGGTASAAWAARRAGAPAVPIGDSRLGASLGYSTD
jgi:hypothetical protein